MTDNITLPRAVVENVLEVLEEATYYTSCTRWSPSMTDECKAATTALRAALAEPVQEPVPRLITTEPWGWLNPPNGEVQRNLAVNATWASKAAVNPPYPLYLGHPEDNYEP